MIRSGDLLAWSGTGLIGRLIRAVTGSTYSHVGIAIWVGPHLMVAELVEFSGSRLVPLSHRAPFRWTATGLDWTPELEAHVLGHIGRIGYSYLNAIRAGLGLDSRTGAMQCAQFAEGVYRAAGLLKDTKPDTPEALVRRVEKAVGISRSAWVSG